MYRQAHKLGNLDATINLAFCYLTTEQKLGPEYGRTIATALLKYGYRNGKVDALDYLCQYGLVHNRDDLLVEIVHEADEHGVDNELQTMAQIDALPIRNKSLSSARPVYPSQTQE